MEHGASTMCSGNSPGDASLQLTYVIVASHDKVCSFLSSVIIMLIL